MSSTVLQNGGTATRVVTAHSVLLLFVTTILLFNALMNALNLIVIFSV